MSARKMISPTGKKILLKKHIFCCCLSSPLTLARNELGRLSLKLTIDINIFKFWIHLQYPPDDNIVKQCLELSKDMAEKNQRGISQKIKTLCDEYSSRSMILNENNGKTLISSVAQNLSKVLVNHKRKTSFYYPRHGTIQLEGSCSNCSEEESPMVRFPDPKQY